VTVSTDSSASSDGMWRKAVPLCHASLAAAENPPVFSLFCSLCHLHLTVICIVQLPYQFAADLRVIFSSLFVVEYLQFALSPGL